MSTILLVEDERDLLEIDTEILEMLGHVVVGASDAEKALALARKASLDLVITDWHLPGMDGLELTRRLRQDEQLRDVPIILHSADPDPHCPCVRSFLPKPCDLDEMEEAITDALSARRGYSCRRSGRQPGPLATSTC